MKLNKTIICTLAVALTLSSCKKQLNQLPPQALTSDLVFTNITAAESVLNGTYAPLRSGNYYGRNFVVMNDITTDNLIATSWFSNNYSDWQRNTYNSSTYETRDFWSTLYNAIHRVNTFLKNVDNVSPIAGENATTVAASKQSFKAQAYALRALYLFDLLRTYSKIDLNDRLGVPMVLEPTTEIQIPRQTVKQNYDQIISDLNQAESLIGETNVTSQIKVNKYFIAALQSRVYLYYKDYQKASDAADKVMAGSFGYETTAAGLTSLWTNDVSTKEIIFKIGIEAVQESGAVNYGVFFINDNGGSLLPNPDFIPSKSVIDLFSATDLRTAQYLKSYTVRQFATPLTLVQKYPGNPSYKSYSDKANAPKLLRYAEVALNKMEAQYYLSKTTAKTLLKALRSARITGYNTALVDAYDDATLLNEIRIERRRELAFEGHEFFDLKRWGLGFSRPKDGTYMATENAIGDVPATNYRFQWPIPQAERESNKAAEQNPGYAN
ncbi:hypothetical protein SRABI27_02034 [Pedobacter sp. Bi27]|uniref:RagB/SusD family nutrient uptake outer membrane protein n=1 Tax=unclassified Pedobacter TaxID=2628915 RepID=UPI001E028026|nr:MULTISPECIES: RagB/SusD family nutrient uptake outer membrane protein [unclassified Pedobacter]CAH0189368.1 hypothetical protein SRABI36_01711 [Pedobacter sp. Bi36]CAH0212942.1 hypothetical protein SRABI27_02034 [Pedobacter sp. Bi27]CAH0245211.1 hypothetical protein SRABI126_02805 [Pedobacter sp. Bi126]